MLNVTHRLEKPLKLFLNATANETMPSSSNITTNTTAATIAASFSLNPIVLDSLNNKSKSIYMKTLSASTFGSISTAHVNLLNSTTPTKLFISSTLKPSDAEGFLDPILTLGKFISIRKYITSIL